MRNPKFWGPDGYKILAADICTAFTECSIGSKVIDYDAFMSAVETAIEAADWSKEGQQVLRLPSEIHSAVRCGVGEVQPEFAADDFVIRKFRGKWGTYLRGEHAAPTTSVHVVVYTKEAYLIDPDLSVEGIEGTEYHYRMIERLRARNVDYVIIAVLANTGEPNAKPPYGSRVLVHNIAGGNNTFKPLPAHEDMSEVEHGRWEMREKARLYDWFVELAQASEKHEAQWMTVADFA